MLASQLIDFCILDYSATTSVHSTITNTNSLAEKTDFSPPPTLKRNEEIGRFELGSTVILVWPPSEKEQIWLIEESQPIKLGQPILQIKSMQ